MNKLGLALYTCQKSLDTNEVSTDKKYLAAVSIICFIFYRNNRQKGQGTGLGLSLAYDIVVKEHSGALEVVSTVGAGLSAGWAGSEFIIQLPLKNN